jgi:UDP-GlcNAc:undecaprenyl-phosphate GlcNAc-1-phosphate transferase
LVLAIPLSDTFYAILRRVLNRQPISKPDKNHLHHSLLHLGFSHRTTVLIIYAISIIFGLIAVVLTKLAMWVAIIAVLLFIVGIQLLAEFTGLMSKRHKPLLTFISSLKERFK